jgi:hypothetical protein
MEQPNEMLHGVCETVGWLYRHVELQRCKRLRLLVHRCAHRFSSPLAAAAVVAAAELATAATLPTPAVRRCEEDVRRCRRSGRSSQRLGFLFALWRLLTIATAILAAVAAAAEPLATLAVAAAAEPLAALAVAAAAEPLATLAVAAAAEPLAALAVAAAAEPLATLAVAAAAEPLAVVAAAPAGAGLHRQEFLQEQELPDRRSPEAHRLGEPEDSDSGV